jgi:FkbM family methyltransferase
LAWTKLVESGDDMTGLAARRTDQSPIMTSHAAEGREHSGHVESPLQPPSTIEVNIPLGSFTSTLFGLFQKGARYSTVIDLGCADGNFCLEHSIFGLFQDSVFVNIDANPVYEGSLRTIKETLGGHYLIAAVTDSNGEVEMTTSVHPYWNSLCPKDHHYWDSIRHLHRDDQGTIKVPATTLDDVARRFDLAPPFLIKLDVQGNEVKALRGARAVLEDTSVVICEAGMGDFEAIHQLMLGSGFDLFDLTHLNWFNDRSLGWFYPVYLSRKLAHFKAPPDWKTSVGDQVVEKQVQRREAILKQNALILDHLRASRNAAEPNVL